jgi:hypothetical protein
MSPQRRFNLSKLDAMSAKLYLMIGAAQELQLTRGETTH